MRELETNLELRPIKLTPIERHPLKSKLVRTLGAALAVAALLTLTGCNDVETTNVSGATTQLKLLDVTTAAAAKVSKSGESFWGTPNGNILRCYNTNWELWRMVR